MSWKMLISFLIRSCRHSICSLRMCLSVQLSLACPIGLFTCLPISGTALLNSFLGPETADDWRNDGVNYWLQKPLVDPEKHWNDDAGNAHHCKVVDRGYLTACKTQQN